MGGRGASKYVNSVYESGAGPRRPGSEKPLRGPAGFARGSVWAGQVHSEVQVKSKCSSVVGVQGYGGRLRGWPLVETLVRDEDRLSGARQRVQEAVAHEAKDTAYHHKL